MEQKFTKGPWRIQLEYIGNDRHIFSIIDTNHDTRIGSTHSFSNDIGKTISNSNANLIAASPELLEMLEIMVDYADDLQDAGPAPYGWKSDKLIADIAKAKEIIKKAYGEQ